MKALQYMGPNVLELREVENPVLKSGEVLVKIRACGICGSDVHGWLGKTGRRIPPMTMGHEFSGEIAELGADANRFSVGDRVIVHPVIFCGECDFCEEDGFCEDVDFEPECCVYDVADAADAE